MNRSAQGPSKLEFRDATLADSEAIAQLHARSWRENYRGAFTDAYLDGDLSAERLKVWRERLANPPADQFVRIAVAGAELAGFVCARGADDAEWGSLLDNLHVAAEFKRKAIASTLMRSAGAWLDEHHPELGVYLWVLEGNASARRFYERIGARNQGVSLTETHGGAIVRSCRYTWPRPASLTGSRRPDAK